MDLIKFEEKNVRFSMVEGVIWYALVDVVESLTDSSDPTQYLKKLRARDEELKSYLGTNCTQVAIEGESGKKRHLLCGTREHILRLVQSIPSPKAEPFKIWLANAGEQNMLEEEDPTFLLNKLKGVLKRKGYDDEWIGARIRSILVRNELTEEWQKRGVKGSEYAILTDEIMLGAFDLTTKEHKILKGLVKESLRDNMSNMELIFAMLGEETARTLSIKHNAQGFLENKNTAAEGGRLAGESRKRLEKQIGISVVTKNNHLDKGGVKNI